MSLLLLASCRPVTDRGSATSAITILYPGDEWVLGPSWDDSPKFLMFLPLVNYEKGSSCGEPTPALAMQWEHSADYTVWTVWLRDNVSWHDGVPVTAHDIKFTIDLLKHPDVRNYNAGPVDSVVVVDLHTVRFYLSKPDRWPVEGWAVFFPKHLLEDLNPAEFAEWEFWTRPVGNGPFRYVRHVPQTMMELEANPDFYRGKPRLDRVILSFRTAGSGIGHLEMRAGAVDLNPVLGLLEANELAEDSRFRTYYRVSESHTRWLLYHPRHPLLRERTVRRAITRAIDRALLHRALDLPDGLTLTDAPYSVCQFVRNTLAEPWPYDPVEAARLLEGAGWRDEDGDGVRDARGVVFRFTTLVDEGDRRTAVFLQDQLRRVGIRMEVQTLERTAVVQRIRNGAFDAAIPPVVHIQSMLRASPTDAAWADTMYRAAYPRIVAMIDTLAGEPDLAESERLYRQLALAFREQLPATYLHPKVYPLVAHRRIRGFDHDGWIPPSWRWPFGGVEWLWVNDEDGGE